MSGKKAIDTSNVKAAPDAEKFEGYEGNKTKEERSWMGQAEDAVQEVLDPVREKIDEAKESFSEGEYKDAAGEFAMAVVEMANPRKKIKVVKSVLKNKPTGSEKNKDTGDKSSKKIDPPGTKRNSQGRLYNEKTGRYVEDPNTPKKKYRRSKAERKKALLRDANDPNSNLTPEAKEYIKKNKGNKVPDSKYNKDYEGDVDYAVHHEKPLHTEKTIEGKKEKDIADNMETIPKDDHIATHRKCGDSFHDYPRRID